MLKYTMDFKNFFKKASAHRFTDEDLYIISVTLTVCFHIKHNIFQRQVKLRSALSENGASLKASGFICEGEAGGVIWTGKRKRDNGVPKEKKKRWAKHFK